MYSDDIEKADKLIATIATMPAIDYTDCYQALESNAEADVRRDEGRVELGAAGVTEAMRSTVVDPVLNRLRLAWNASTNDATFWLSQYNDDYFNREKRKLDAGDKSINDEYDTQIDHTEDVERGHTRLDQKYKHAERELAKATEEFESIARTLSMKRGFSVKSAKYWPLPIYILILMLLGVVDLFINFGSFKAFFHGSSDAIALGGAILTGIAVAVSSHVVGAFFLKQFESHFITADRTRELGIESASELMVNIAVVIIFGLVLLGAVLGVVYWARYQQAIGGVSGILAMDIPGMEGTGGASPVSMDVFISVLLNFAVFLIGVAVAFFSHDKSPKLIEKDKKMKKWAKRYEQLKRKHNRKKRVYENQVVTNQQRAGGEKEFIAELERKRDELRDTLGEQRRKVIASAIGQIEGGVRSYTTTMDRLAIQFGVELQFEREGQRLTTGDVQVDRSFIEQILGRDLG